MLEEQFHFLVNKDRNILSICQSKCTSAAKEGHKHRPKASTQEKRPEVIGKLKRKHRGAEKINIILKQVNDLYKANNFQLIHFYKLIIDLENFMNAVENAFQLSFLARDDCGSIVKSKRLVIRRASNFSSYSGSELFMCCACRSTTCSDSLIECVVGMVERLVDFTFWKRLSLVFGGEIQIVFCLSNWDSC
ncbi:uncharacterized protein ACN427_002253 isoform 1-T1 [Glossina fuscipes fuscipes]